MDVSTGAIDSRLPKLGELLMEEYMLQARLKKDVQHLCTELTVMYAALRENNNHNTDDAEASRVRLCLDRSAHGAYWLLAPALA
ncbi:hypothetical protein ZWY2020_028020 [Hordeum vulgare]|nr:hypothetical protein ZWY2020_028020 [Hordeum vulgare]